MPNFARGEIQEIIKKRIDAFNEGYRQNIGLIGSLGLGKSFHLQLVYNKYSAQEQSICIYVQIESFDYEQMLDRWLGGVLTGFLASTGRENLPSDLASLIQLAEKRIPRTARKVRQLSKQSRRQFNDEAASELFGLTKILAEETEKKVILILDEFQALEHLALEDPFALLGKEIMVQTNTLFLVSSSKPEKARGIFREKLSLLFGNFETIELKPFSILETVSFLQYHFPRTKFTDRQKRLFMHLTDGEPLYLELVLDRLKFYVSSHADQVVSDQLVFLAFQEELFDYRGRLALIFEKKMQPIISQAKDSLPCVRALLAIAEGKRRIPEIAAAIDRKTTEVKKILARLVRTDMVCKQGSFYLIEDALFAFWLTDVYKRRSTLYRPAEKRAGDELYGSLQMIMEKLEHVEQAGLTARLERLLKEFRNDSLEFEGRKWLCPQFNEIVSRPARGRFQTLIAKTSKSRWFCQVAAEFVEEEDVSSFVQEIKATKKRVHQKVIIALKGIDQNARLLAHDSKITLWSLKDINSLLRAYHLTEFVFLDDIFDMNVALQSLALGKILVHI